MAERITIEKKDEGLLIKISAFKNEAKQKQLTVWLLAWTFCGLVIASQLFIEADSSTKRFIMIFLVFWLYFEWKIVKVYRWRIAGEEQFLITDDNFFMEGR